MALPSSKSEYWLAWLRYDSKADGCVTHAVPSDSQRAVCGVVPTEFSGDSVAINRPNCKRCLGALERVGLLFE